MSTSRRDAYIVVARRTPVGRRNGIFGHTRPDDLLAHVLRKVVAALPGLEPADIADVIAGCAMPEAEQGMNVARIAALLAGLPDRVPGVTVNRFCASGLQAVADAAARIRLGEAEVVIAAGVESMSVMPQITGNVTRINPAVFADEDTLGIAYGMGLTAEKVARRWQVSREAQDAFALRSHQRALAAQQAGWFDEEIAAFEVLRHAPGADGQAGRSAKTVSRDEGPRADTSAEALTKLRPAFAADGTVTAGNSSQMSDGAAAVLLMSEAALKRYKVEPVARFAGFAVAGVAPEIMGIGPVEAVPLALQRAGCTLADVGWIELNEAFAAQALAVIDELGLDPERVNPAGGAIALGHPLGATGAIRVATLAAAMRRDASLRYGLVTMCVGTGMGAAGVFERC